MRQTTEPARGDHPINCVDWDMAVGYCAQAKKRLPTEAEWEFAARGPDGRRYPWGDDAPDKTIKLREARACQSHRMADNLMRHVWLRRVERRRVMTDILRREKDIIGKRFQKDAWLNESGDRFKLESAEGFDFH